MKSARLHGQFSLDKKADLTSAIGVCCNAANHPVELKKTCNKTLQLSGWVRL